MLNIRPSYGRALGALGVACFVLITLVVAYRFTPPIAWRVGEQDAFVFNGFHDLETANQILFRWSDGASAVRLPQVGQSTFGLVALQTWGPGTLPPVPLTIVANQERLLTTSMHGLRVLHLLVPGQVIAGGDVHFDLLSPTWRPANDQRDLGIGIARVSWQSSRPLLPPVQQLWVLPTLALSLALLLTRLGLNSVTAGVSGALV
ncbi:MAG: hypothetical protein H0X37_25045, partial [Herpetosiphonaceae bacterium]|nr:hypothetical protein [Herpetosiphonaceae bacterium]